VDVVRMVAPYIPNEVATIIAAERPDPYGIDAETHAAKEAIDEVVKGLTEAGLKAHATVRVEMSPVKSILAHLEETTPDVLALATQGRGLSRLIVGSVADKLIRSAKRPVLVLRPMKDLVRGLAVNTAGSEDSHGTLAMLRAARARECIQREPQLLPIANHLRHRRRQRHRQRTTHTLAPIAM
jgi:nucleotide-binding universal stress UspA family protein